MKIIPLIVLFIGFLITAGCGQYVKEKQSTLEQLNGRLEAASGVTDPGKRNESLAVLAEDAAA